MKRRKKPVFNLQRKVIAALRKLDFYSPMRAEAARLARYEGMYKCAVCFVLSPKAVIDHIEPVVDPQEGFVDWNTFVERLFVPASQRQNLCKAHHDEKSKEENALRRKVKSRE